MAFKTRYGNQKRSKSSSRSRTRYGARSGRKTSRNRSRSSRRSVPEMKLVIELGGQNPNRDMFNQRPVEPRKRRVF